jgi:hypothetical protein
VTLAWKARVIPFYEPRMVGVEGFEPSVSCSQSRRIRPDFPTLRCMVENTGIEPVVPEGGGFTVHCITIDASSPDCGAGLRNRTSINGFGDRCNAIIPDRHIGGGGQIRTDDCRDLQSLALVHSATPP